MYGAFCYTSSSKGNVDVYLMGVYDSVESFNSNKFELKESNVQKLNHLSYPKDDKEIALKEGETMFSLEELIPNQEHYYKHPLKYVEFTI